MQFTTYFSGCSGAGPRGMRLFSLPLGEGFSLHPQSEAGGSKLQVNTSRMITKFGQMFRLVSDDNIVETASSMQTTFRFPEPLICCTSLKSGSSRVRINLRLNESSRNRIYLHHRNRIKTLTIAVPNFIYLLIPTITDPLSRRESTHEIFPSFRF